MRLLSQFPKVGPLSRCTPCLARAHLKSSIMCSALLGQGALQGAPHPARQAPLTATPWSSPLWRASLASGTAHSYATSKHCGHSVSLTRHQSPDRRTLTTAMTIAHLSLSVLEPTLVANALATSAWTPVLGGGEAVRGHQGPLRVGQA